MRTYQIVPFLCCLSLSTACSGDGAGAAATAEKAKAAEAAKKKEDEAHAAAMAERKAKREAEEKLKADAEAKVASALETLCVVPEKFTGDPVKACDEVGKAYDAFIRRVSEPADLQKWEAGGSENGISMKVVQCAQANSAKVAACQKNALDGAGPELKDHAKKLLRTCIDKFAGKAPAGRAAAVPKRRPG